VADEAAKLVAKMPVRDGGECTCLFEPLLVSEGATSRPQLSDLALSLAEKSAALSSSLPPVIAGAFAELSRTVNCYYSSLIEGHRTRPIDIERAVRDDFSDDPETRVLQLEARAHVAVQQWIDEDTIDGRPFSTKAICEIHRRLCIPLPSEFEQGDTGSDDEKLAMLPGAIRSKDVQVGRHIAISPGAVPRFLVRMEQGYNTLGRIDKILSAACGHHRFLWVHPFPDGNGRVARFLSYATLRAALSTGGLWSVSRGLARREKEYKTHLQSCDEPRSGGPEGRGGLSEGALASFAEFFLGACLEEVDFTRSLLEPQKLRNRVLTWAEEEVRAGILPPRSEAVLAATLYSGQLARAEVATLTGASDRSARRLTAALIKSGIVKSETSRAPIQLAFPIGLAARLLPGLFTEG